MSHAQCARPAFVNTEVCKDSTTGQDQAAEPAFVSTDFQMRPFYHVGSALQSSWQAGLDAQAHPSVTSLDAPFQHRFCELSRTRDEELRLSRTHVEVCIHRLALS